MATEAKKAADRRYYEKNRERLIAYQKDYYQQNKDQVKARIRKSDGEKRKRRREQALARLGGRCKDCGFDNPAGLQFHHRDPAEKLFEIAAGLTRPEAVLWAEVDKCDLLCGTCHLLRHAED